MPLKVYLAGPEVFLPNPTEIGEAKKAICAKHGLSGVFPLDGIVLDPARTPFQNGLAVWRANKDALTRCDLGIANCTPFLGPAMDVGTAFEIGALAALGKPVYGYSHDPAPYATRHRAAAEATAEAADIVIEDFEMTENCMIHGAVYDGGHMLVAETAGAPLTDLTLFEAAVARAAAECVTGA